MAKNLGGIEIPVDRMEGAPGRPTRTQDVGGGYSYNGQDSGAGARRIQQNAITPSLSAAGGSSAYIMADLLQVTKRTRVSETTGQPVKPRSKALQEVVEPGKKDPRGPLTVSLDPAEIKVTLGLVDRALGTKLDPDSD